MSEKTYSAVEVAKALLKKCQETIEKQKSLKKAEDIDKCGMMSKSSKLKDFLAKKKEVEKADVFDIKTGKKDEKLSDGPPAKTSAPKGKLSLASNKKPATAKDNYLQRFPKAAVNKAGEMPSAPMAPSSPAPMGKKEDKGVHSPEGEKGQSKAGQEVRDSSYYKKRTKEAGKSVANNLAAESKKNAVRAHKKVISEQKEMSKPNLPKSEDAAGAKPITNKVMGLIKDPSDKAKEPKVDAISKPPKAATTLKSFMAQKKK